MKFHQLITCVVALACPAAAQVTGTAFGPWTQLNANSTKLDALLVVDQDTEASLALHATLLGVDLGQIVGTITPVKTSKPPPLKGLDKFQYTVLGDWIDLGDGRLFVHSQILLDVGAEQLLPVGLFDGVLLNAGEDLTGPRTDTFIPIPPPTNDPNGAGANGGPSVPAPEEFRTAESVRRPFKHLPPLQPVVRPGPLTPIDETLKPIGIQPIEPVIVEITTGKFLGYWTFF